MIPRALAAGALASLAVAAAAAAPLRADDDTAIVHVLSRTTFGPRPGDVERVRATGIERWLESQLTPEAIDDTAIDHALTALPSLALSTADLQRSYPRVDPTTQQMVASGQMTREDLRARFPLEKRPPRITAEMQTARLMRAVGSGRQLQEVMVDFWLNHFNVFAGKGEVRWYLPSYERDAIRPHALGHFRDLLRATAHHPAMLFYLDNWLSTRADFVVPAGPNRGKRAGLNENYARELMELHTLGVDGGYTQKDVTEVARAFTGWTIDHPREDASFVFRPRLHDTADKTILGQRFVAGRGQDEGERVLDLLARHPSTARFLATKLVRRFVADDPPPALVSRVAAVYRQTDGDVRALLRAILTSPEFAAAARTRDKVKTPFEYVASAARALGASVDTRGAWSLAQAAAEIGEPLYAAQPPTGYPDRAEAWVNAGALLARLNFALALTDNRLPGVNVDPARLVDADTRRAPEAALDRLLAVLLHGRVTPETHAVLAAQLGNPEVRRQTPDEQHPDAQHSAANTDVAKLAALVIGSPEFQRR